MEYDDFNVKDYVTATEASRLLRVSLAVICTRLSKYGKYLKTVKVGRTRYIHKTSLNSIYMR